MVFSVNSSFILHFKTEDVSLTVEQSLERFITPVPNIVGLLFLLFDFVTLSPDICTRILYVTHHLMWVYIWDKFDENPSLDNGKYGMEMILEWIAYVSLKFVCYRYKIRYKT